MRIFIALFVVLSSISLTTLHAEDADQIMNRVMTKINRVKDYQADVQISPHIPMINIQPMQGSILYKNGKVRLKSTGIAILPKQGFSDLNRLMQNRSQFMAVAAGTDKIDGHDCTIITLLPKSDTMDVLVSKLWIEKGSDLIIKASITTRSAGTLSIDYHYQSQRDFALPDELVFNVDIKKFKLPKGVATDINRKSADTNNSNTPSNGSINVKFSNYKINKGISDELMSQP